MEPGSSLAYTTVTVARDGEAGLGHARENPSDIMILDVMLPKMTGLEVCKLLRGEGSEVPIIMLTARGQEIDKVLGLKLGADDYVTKPFSFMELMVRVEAVLRRSQPGDGPQSAVHEFGDVTVDTHTAKLRKKIEDDPADPQHLITVHRLAYKFIG